MSVKLKKIYGGVGRMLFVAALCLMTLHPLFSTSVHAADLNKLVRNALKLYEKGNYDKALKQFVKILRTDPNNSMAREYMLLCSQKIVEHKLGHQVAETVEKEINVERQIQTLQDSAAMPAAPEPESFAEEPRFPSPSSTVDDALLEEVFASALKLKVPETQTPAAPPSATPEFPGGAPSPDTLAGPTGLKAGRPEETTPFVPVSAGAPAASPAVPTPSLSRPAPALDDWKAVYPEAETGTASVPSNAQPILQRRRNLTEELRRRQLGNENIVQLHESGRKIEVTLFLNRLFLPNSPILRDDAFAVLEHVISRVRAEPKRKVVLKALDSSGAAARGLLPDLAAKRCTILFSYLLHSSLQQKAYSP